MPFKYVLFLIVFLITEPAFASNETAEYVGREVCATCHKQQLSEWTGSHHDLAMQHANEKTVLGDFNNASLTQFGVTSSFFKKGDRFMVRTEGPDGKLQDYQIKYTFGVNPLQQYLVEFPGGRLQALSLAWDTRPRAQGGQRWFHLYPDEKISHDDELHWTKQSQNWNSMCAECHSTRLEKNYDEVTDSYQTSWFEINVSCEACHGPGSKHVRWARKVPGWEKHTDGMGLVQQLDERKGVSWTINPETGNAVRSSARKQDKEIEMCARCHSRRSPITDKYQHGDRLTDHYRPRLLDESMYFADGQMRDEVYVYGSFLQSKMYQSGVTCSDCHDPHRAEPRIKGNGICLQCHQATKYDNSDHHFHKLDQAGASCVECHMPPRNYMVVDPRHDHSMRIPRPDISQELGTPNACTTCHTDKDNQWAASHFKKWYPMPAAGHRLFAEKLAKSRNHTSGTGELMASIIRESSAPNIVRATALTGITPYLSRDTIDTIESGLTSSDPLMRIAALDVLQQVPVATRVPLAFQLLEDPVRSVRIEAALILAGIPAGQLSDQQKKVLDNATREYIESQQAMGERPAAQTNLATIYNAQGKFLKAEQAYKRAIAINPVYIPAYLNYADFKRAEGNEKGADKLLRQALEISPGKADVQHALGLSLVRQQRLDEAVKMLEEASHNAPDNDRYTYVYAVALDTIGQTQQAIMVLHGAHNRFPENPDILNALVVYNQKQGNQEAVSLYMNKLRALQQ